MQKTDNISKKILLGYHYRCASNIIEFSNDYYYGERLCIENKNKGEVLFFDVQNRSDPRRNCYEEEADAVAELLKSGRFTGQRVAVIAPFNNQVRLIREKLKSAGITNTNGGTIHKVQDMAYDTIILSCSLSKTTKSKTFNWIKDNEELINVAVTSSKENFVVAADTKAVNRLTGTERSALQELVNYAKAVSEGKAFVVVSPKGAYGNLSNNSEYERQFFEPLSQIVSVTGK